MTSYRYVGNHAQEVVVGDTCVMIGAGDFIDLEKGDLDNHHTKDMIDTGVLVHIPSATKAAKTPEGGDK